ncbi:ribonuclease J [Ruminococcaceae bacterium OttesenSCG-928-A16]|nr:ribonuclease J [Ruminococcaceae bacterium OttesenSCG-928-A16]
MNQQLNNKQPQGAKKTTRRPAAANTAKGGSSAARGPAGQGNPKQVAKPNAAKPAAPAAPKNNGRRPGFYAPRPRRQKQEEAAVGMKIYPLGGLGEIGKNMTVYECNDDMMIVDCGSLFPDSDMYGIDLVIPDFTFIDQNRDKIRGIAITHGHEDHIGALPYLLREINLPIFATRLTIGLIENKLEEHGLRSSADLRLITVGEKFKMGCFTIDPIHVNHSIPDAVAFAIDCPAGIVIQTGDFKIDFTPIGGPPIDLATFAEYGEKGVLALLSDSTNAERPGMSTSESKVNDGLQTLFARATKSRIIIATFASNLYRVQQIVDLAMQYGRKVAISGRSMINNTQMARELGYLKAPQEVFIEVEQINKYPPEQVALITTGSQGETLSALSRMAGGSHRQVRVGPGDFIIISATPIPGNEKMVTRVVNGLLKLGAEVIYEKMYEVHASGHACQEEQKTILNLVKPQYFIPVHGEYKHLKRHAMIGETMGIPHANILVADTGDTIQLSKKGVSLGDVVPAGAVMVDGLGVGDVGSVVLRDRRLLSQDGIVVLAASVDSASGQLVSAVELFSRGFVYVRDSEELLEETRHAVQRVLENNDGHRDINSLKTRMRETASSLLYKRTKRSPMILPVLTEV